MPITNGCNHVALVTEDLDRFIDFYVSVFDAEVTMLLDEGELRHALLDLGGGFCLHPFQLAEDTGEGRGSDDIFRRGHLDHLAIGVDDEETLRVLARRLVEAGASDGSLTDFGIVRTVWFEDPDGMGCEVALTVPGARALRHDQRRVESLV